MRCVLCLTEAVGTVGEVIPVCIVHHWEHRKEIEDEIPFHEREWHHRIIKAAGIGGKNNDENI